MRTRFWWKSIDIIDFLTFRRFKSLKMTIFYVADLQNRQNYRYGIRFVDFLLKITPIGDKNLIFAWFYRFWCTGYEFDQLFSQNSSNGQQKSSKSMKIATNHERNPWFYGSDPKITGYPSTFYVNRRFWGCLDRFEPLNKVPRTVWYPLALRIPVWRGSGAPFGPPVWGPVWPPFWGGWGDPLLDPPGDPLLDPPGPPKNGVQTRFGPPKSGFRR